MKRNSSNPGSLSDDALSDKIDALYTEMARDRGDSVDPLIEGQLDILEAEMKKRMAKENTCAFSGEQLVDSQGWSVADEERFQAEQARREAEDELYYAARARINNDFDV
ncbi:MAG: hypothetical protein NUV49_00905 [Patescibacteria group bacterium]|nr:hypothetical protein [Patescibacteria group bacterium]